MNLHQEFLDKILFVIVVYKQDPAKCPAFKSLCSSFPKGDFRCHISIYNNSPTLDGFTNETQHTIYIHHDPTNPGLSKSYNLAYHEAFALRKRWLFLLDQDTSFSFDCLLAYDFAVQQFPNEILFAPIVKDNKGILSPLRFSWGKGTRIKHADAGLTLFHQLRPINSGMMIRLDAFERVNGFEECIRLDFSDFVFIEKLKAFYENFVVTNTVLHTDFFDSRSMSKSHAIHRFKIFSEGISHMAQMFGPTWIYYYRGLVRATYLSLRFRSIIFIKILIGSKEKTQPLQFQTSEINK